MYRAELFIKNVARKAVASLAAAAGPYNLAAIALQSKHQPTKAQAALLPLLEGTGAGLVSVASYQANELIEDRWAMKTGPGDRSLVACVLDGHGGWQAAHFAQEALPGIVLAEVAASVSPEEPEQVAEALTRAFTRCDRTFISAIRPAFDMGFGEVAHVGACALAAVVSPASIVVANAGDCRAVLGHWATAPSQAWLREHNYDAEAGGQDQSGSSYSPNAKSSSGSGLSASSTSLALVNPNDTSADGSGSGRTTSWRGENGLYVVAQPMSEDHNARVTVEQLKLQSKHPNDPDIVVFKDPAWYVKGRLQPTRALGDAYLKHSEFNGRPGARQFGRYVPPPYTPPYITSTPETRIHRLNPNAYGNGSEGSSALIMACDGVWDVVSNEEAVRIVAQDKGNPATVADRFIEYVLEKEAAASHMTVTKLKAVPAGKQRRKLHDDITVMVIYLGKSPANARDVTSPASDGGWLSKLFGRK